MKTCPNCGNQIRDDAAFCPHCGMQFQQAAPGQQPYAAQPGVVYVAPYDHTQEFDPKDISENKVYCMVIYLMGVMGVIVGLLAAQKSPYVSFHVRQALKFTVVDVLLALCMLILCWTLIVPFAVAIMMLVLWVVRIICFVQICQGKAIEPVIIRSLGFLK